MIHFHYIGFIDPRRPVEVTDESFAPLPIRPVPRELVEGLAARFGVTLGDDVEDAGGYLVSHLWGYGKLHPFEAALVAEGCIVMTEMGEVIHPPEAVARYAEFRAEWASQHP